MSDNAKVPAKAPDWFSPEIVPGVDLRQAGGDEEEFQKLRGLHEAAMKESVSAVLGWDRDFQEKRLKSHWGEGNLMWIVRKSDGQTLGCLDMYQQDEALKISQLYLYPEFQGLGIGTHVLGTILKVADQYGQEAKLETMKGSRAEKMYQRLGFEVVLTDQWQNHFVRPANTQSVANISPAPRKTKIGR